MGNTEQLFKRLEKKIKDSRIELNSPATAQEIESLEIAINQKLPAIRRIFPSDERMAGFTRFNFCIT